MRIQETQTILKEAKIHQVPVEPEGPASLWKQAREKVMRGLDSNSLRSLMSHRGVHIAAAAVGTLAAAGAGMLAQQRRSRGFRFKW